MSATIEAMNTMLKPTHGRVQRFQVGDLGILCHGGSVPGGGKRC